MGEIFAGDIAVLLAFLLCLSLLIAIGELLHLRFKWESESTRRLVHAGAGVIIVIAIGQLSSPLYLYLFAAFFAITNIYFSQKQVFSGIHKIKRESWGTVTFPLALIFGLFLCWSSGADRKGILQLSFLLMSISDPIASFVGMQLGRGRKYLILGEKSWVGSLAFVLSASIIVWYFDSVLLGIDLTVSQILLSAFILGVVELLSKKGWDNFFLVLASIALLTVWTEIGIGEQELYVYVPSILVFMLFSQRLEFLSSAGAFAAGLLGMSLLLIGSWLWVFPPLLFFVSSSILSKVSSSVSSSAEVIHEKGSTRDDGQVWANGGVALVFVFFAIFYPNPLWVICLIVSFSAAAADTWATEIGMRWGKEPRSILNLKKVKSGVSGGVSAMGLVGALLGSMCISALVILLDEIPNKATTFVLISIAGFGASIVDSILGASLQAKYEDHLGNITEQPRSDQGANTLVSGFEIINNDVINLLSIASATIFVLLVHQIL